MNDFIPLSVPYFSGNELQYVTEAVNTGWVSTAGSFVSRFEKEFAEYAKVSTAAAVQSGTAALHLAMLECNVGEGDLVIAPTLTFVAAVNPIRYVGAKPVFIDCDDTLCIDPVKIAGYIENNCERRGEALFDKLQNKQLKAIVVVHVFGNGADMERIMDIADENGLYVIEDATEALGTFYTKGRFSGRMCGTIGHIGAYSFNGNKIITTGGGGMLVAKDTANVRHAKHLSTQAKSDELYFDHDEVGYNYRMTNLQAALGVAQLEKIKEFIKIKGDNYGHYQELGVNLLPFSGKVRPNFWFYSHISNDRDGLIKHLEENRVQARPVWKLIHTLPMYRDCYAENIQKAVLCHEKIVNLPCSSNLTREDATRVAGLIKGLQTRIVGNGFI